MKPGEVSGDAGGWRRGGRRPGDYDNPDGDLLPSHHHLNDIYEHDPDFSDGVCALLGDPWDPLCPHPHSRPTLQVRRGS